MENPVLCPHVFRSKPKRANLTQCSAFLSLKATVVISKGWLVVEGRCLKCLNPESYLLRFLNLWYCTFKGATKIMG